MSADTLTDIDKLREGLRKIHEITRDLLEDRCPDEDADCPCYQAGLQEGYEAERRPLGA